MNIQKIFTAFAGTFLNFYPLEKRRNIIFNIIRSSAKRTNSIDSLKFLLELDRQIYSLTGQESVRYGDGIHTKHKHIQYHQFFIKNTDPDTTVLDIGCGNGSLAYDVVSSVKDVKILGIDINETNIELAKKNYLHSNLTFVAGDALNDLPDMKFDTVFLSNVLEHLPNRIEFLKLIQEQINPSRYVLRVPLFERDWRVPLMKELGLDYRLDSTHQIEYTQDEFFNELQNAGLRPEDFEIRWGELWAVARPSKAL